MAAIGLLVGLLSSLRLVRRGRHQATTLFLAGGLLLAACGGDGASGDSHVDRDCSDFPTQTAAQDYFEQNGGSPTNNVDGLDADHDGIACEGLPGGP